MVTVWPSSPASAGTPPSDLEAVQLASGLNRPVAVRHAGDGSDRVFIIEKLGRIRIFDLSTNTLLTTPFLDITGDVDDGGNEQGLLGLAFHPDYATNGFFYVNYTFDPGAQPDRTRIERYTVSGDPNVANASSAVNILEIVQDASNHNGGDIHFGPDGFLYIGMGDGGGAGDTGNNSQNPLELLGKMLRIDVDAATAEGVPLTDQAANAFGGGEDCGLIQNYAVPGDNPFVGADGTCDEIWQIGVRNPFRFSFDRATGDMFIADVGQGAIEEVSFQPASSSGGENWGWRCYEGSNPFNTSGCLPQENYDFPILEYSHGGATAPSPAVSATAAPSRVLSAPTCTPTTAAATSGLPTTTAAPGRRRSGPKAVVPSSSASPALVKTKPASSTSCTTTGTSTVSRASRHRTSSSMVLSRATRRLGRIRSRRRRSNRPLSRRPSLGRPEGTASRRLAVPFYVCAW